MKKLINLSLVILMIIPGAFLMLALGVAWIFMVLYVGIAVVIGSLFFNEIYENLVEDADHKLTWTQLLVTNLFAVIVFIALLLFLQNLTTEAYDAIWESKMNDYHEMQHGTEEIDNPWGANMDEVLKANQK